MFPLTLTFFSLDGVVTTSAWFVSFVPSSISGTCRRKIAKKNKGMSSNINIDWKARYTANERLYLQYFKKRRKYETTTTGISFFLKFYIFLLQENDTHASIIPPSISDQSKRNIYSKSLDFTQNYNFLLEWHYHLQRPSSITSTVTLCLLSIQATAVPKKPFLYTLLQFKVCI